MRSSIPEQNARVLVDMLEKFIRAVVADQKSPHVEDRLTVLDLKKELIAELEWHLKQ